MSACIEIIFFLNIFNAFKPIRIAYNIHICQFMPINKYVINDHSTTMFKIVRDRI